MTNRELSEHLHVSENTIKSHLRRLFAKLDVRNRAQAAALARTNILGEFRSGTRRPAPTTDPLSI